MNPRYRQTVFQTSAARLAQTPPDEGFEIAFAGRSNAGKSSAINALCDQGTLARTSKTPGRTQLLNFFAVDAQHRIVDLPGYGYAKVPEAIQEKWKGFIEHYLGEREAASGIEGALRTLLTGERIQSLRAGVNPTNVIGDWVVEELRGASA